MGLDVAGVVFAKSVMIKAHSKDSQRKSLPPLQVELRRVQYNRDWRAQPMFPNYWSQHWDGRDFPNLDFNGETSGLVDVVATTYASDEVARRLGVFADVPCIVVVDAFASSGFEIVSLGEENLNGILRMLRVAISEFASDSDFKRKKQQLQKLLQIADEISTRNVAIAELGSNFRSTLRAMTDADIVALATAKNWLSEGSVRRFTHLIRTSPLLKSEQAAEAVSRAATFAEKLGTLSKTISSLTWYLAARPWPLTGEDIDRVNTIFETHVSSLLSESIVGRTEWSQSHLRLEIDRLADVSKRLVEWIWGDLLDPDKLAKDHSDAVENLTAQHAKGLEEIRGQIAPLRVAAAELVHGITASSASLVQAFRNAKSALINKPAARSIQVSPEAILAALSERTTINFTMKDLYIAANAGAMGPQAHADNTKF